MRLKQGDIIKLNLNPTIGSEQSGFRPAVVISNDFVISKTNLIFIAPITSKQGSTVFNVGLDNQTKTQGAILCSHIRSVDLSKRPYNYIESLPKNKLRETLDVINSLTEPIS